MLFTLKLLVTPIVEKTASDMDLSRFCWGGKWDDRSETSKIIFVALDEADEAKFKGDVARTVNEPSPGVRHSRARLERLLPIDSQRIALRAG